MVPSQRAPRVIDTPAEVDFERQATAAAVVAEAVALALEAVADEAAEAVLVTAAAVADAAGRAAEAAEAARAARALAADAAAQSVSDEAARTAAGVRERADVTAAQVTQDAALAADRLALEDGPPREAAATAEAQRELTAATAMEVALDTAARATGVATAARETAAALVTAERKARTVEPEADLTEHEAATATSGSGAPARAGDVGEILAAADERDSRAEIRDRVADERERDASLHSFLGAEQGDDHEQHDRSLLVRRAAAMDRFDAMTDRISAASDRHKLSVHLAPGDRVWGFSGGAGTTEVAAELSHHLRAPLSSILASVETLEVALRESDDRLRFLVDAVTDYAIITLDPNGIIQSWNTGAERLKGYTSEEVLGRHFSIFYPAEDRDTGLPQRLLGRARADGSCENTGWRVRRDGSRFWGDIIISALHDDAGNLTGFVKVTRDVTEQHRLETAQDSFYNAFAHDFRVPITAIKGFAELISDADPEDQEYLVERVDSNTNRLLAMVEELVDYARLRSGLTPLTLQPVDMAPLAQLAVANLASIAETSRVQVTATAPVKVLADPAALERVIANLVTNALKYSPAESNVSIVCEEVDEVGVLRIADQGRGIDDRDLGSIFLEFERGRLAQSDSGTGLGLASVQRLVDLQHGSVDITSEVDVGTTVTIQLPLV